MSWLRALKETARSGLEIERGLEPLIAFRGAAGARSRRRTSLFLGPEIAASFGAFQAANATFQRSWRPRPVLALVSSASLAVSTFLGYVTASNPVLFLSVCSAAGPSSRVLPGRRADGRDHRLVQRRDHARDDHPADLRRGRRRPCRDDPGRRRGPGGADRPVPGPRWGAQRDALADALAAEADYARRLRHDPVAPFDPLPLMTARSAAAVTRRQARRRPAELHGARGIAERLRPVLASLADPAMGVPADGLSGPG
ncbi:hypothetical protein SMICM17S_09749 [Streptomyces microflavus]